MQDDSRVSLQLFATSGTSTLASPDTQPAVGAVVAIPVCNERDHIAACLLALDQQVGVPAASFGVLLFLNNCTDGTEAIVASTAPHLSCRLRIVVCDHPQASAGWARRRAMDASAAWLEESGRGEGALLTTDADSRVPPDWIARNLDALDAGADAVAGRLALDPTDAAALPEVLHVRGALEAAYEALLVEIVAKLDPAPGNPWPTHWCRSGASLAARLSAYRAIGGMPDMPCGEDRAFVEAMLAHDLVVRHDPDLVVVTSGRLLGRAKGGVADTIRLRCDALDTPCDERLERLERVVARALLRRHLRGLHSAGRRTAIRLWVRALSVERGTAVHCADLPNFGAFHAGIEASSPRLGYRPLRPAELPRQISRARRFAAMLRDRSKAGISSGHASLERPTPTSQMLNAYDQP